MKVIICKTDCETAMECIRGFITDSDVKNNTDDIRTNIELIEIIERTNYQFDRIGFGNISLFEIAEIPDDTTDFKIIISNTDSGYFEYLLYVVDGKIYEWNSKKD